MKRAINGLSRRRLQMKCEIDYARHDGDDGKVVAVFSLERNRPDDPEVWHIISQKISC